MTRKHIVSSEQAEELVHRVYEKASVEEPSKALDDSILAKSREGLETPESPKDKNPLQSLQRFGSLAATVVVVVTIGLIYHENRHELAPENPVRLMSESAPVAEDNQAARKTQALQPEEASPRPEEMSPQPEALAPQPEAMQESLEYADKLAEEPAPAPASPEKKTLSEQRSILADEVPTTQSDSEEAIDADSADLTYGAGGDGPAGVSGASLPASVPKEERQEFAPAMQRMMKAVRPDPYQEKLQAVREAIAAGDNQLAREKWAALKQAYPDATLPGDLVHFFGNNDQIGEPDQVNGDTTTDDPE